MCRMMPSERIQSTVNNDHFGEDDAGCNGNNAEHAVDAVGKNNSNTNNYHHRYRNHDRCYDRRAVPPSLLTLHRSPLQALPAPCEW